jgi:retron-type reverse transcriptase
MNKVDLTRFNQHKFKPGRSAATLSTDLQSIIATALDNDDYVLVLSLDITTAFDMVNIDLLIKRLKIMGLLVILSV